MDGLLQSANDALNSILHVAGGYFDSTMSTLRPYPYATAIVALAVFGAWLFKRRDPSLP
jgi:hypothetical protein